MVMSIPLNRKFKQIAIQAAKEAGEIAKKDFYRKKSISLKKDLSFVTETDLRAERVILNLIRKNFPSHDILSEESGGSMGENYTWILDPLDGTTNFIRGIPLFSVCIALLYKKKPILAVVFNSIADELYVAQKGKGAFLNNKRIRVSTARNLKQAIILFNMGRGMKSFLSFLRTSRRLAGKIKSLRIFGSSNLQICSVAAGKFDGYLSLMSSPWDLLPGALIAEEAGAKITDKKGGAFRYDEGGLLAANSHIHKKILYAIYDKK